MRDRDEVMVDSMSAKKSSRCSYCHRFSPGPFQMIYFEDLLFYLNGQSHEMDQALVGMIDSSRPS